jgi:glycerophosphoryl diester phosphodiesterase
VTRPASGHPFLDAGLEHPGSVLAFAHRGGAFHPDLEGLENTLAALQHAVDLGYRHLETDVHATRDGVLLAFHDAALDRVTSRTGRLEDLRYGDVAAALIGDREEIPTVQTLLDHFPDTFFNIDIKSGAAVEPLARLLASTCSEHRVCVASFSHRRIAAFRRHSRGRVLTAASPPEAAAFRFSPGPLPRRRPPHPGPLQVPCRFRGVTVVTPRLVARAHRSGRQVHVWTVDDPGEMHRLLDLGVDGLMTDRTGVLREVLLDRRQWMGVAQ